MIDPSHLTATAASQAIADGKLTSERLVAACLERIAEREPAIGAWETLDVAYALAQAAERDRSPVRGPLHGIPIGIKDIIDTAALPTGYGSPIYRGQRPSSDAACVSRLLAAGAVVLGKTVTTEFANLHPGKTRNPHDLARTPGGSSSGSAAAVAADMVPLALGTQTGGSVIRPASFCGVFGFKTTIGRTDTRGIRELARSFDTLGWMARAATDLALLAPVVIDGFRPVQVPRRPRIGLCRTPYHGAASTDMLDALATTGAALKQAGADVEPVELPASFGRLRETHGILMGADAVSAFAREYVENLDLLSDTFRAHIERGRALSAETIADARAEAERARQGCDTLLTGYDALLTPGAAGEAPVGTATGDPVFSGFWSLLGTPCLGLPAARGPHGMPLGLQLVGRRGGDEGILALGAWVEAQKNVLIADTTR